MKYEGNFSENDIRLIYEDRCGSRPDIRVMKRYKVKNGYVALIVMYNKYRLLFADNDYLQVRVATLPDDTDKGAIEAISDVAYIISAEEIH